MQTKQLRLGMGVVLLAVWLTGALCVAGTLEADDPMLRQVWEAHIQERARMGLPPLHLNHLLMAAARVQVQDLATWRTLTHEGADGSHPRNGLNDRAIAMGNWARM